MEAVVGSALGLEDAEQTSELSSAEAVGAKAGNQDMCGGEGGLPDTGDKDGGQAGEAGPCPSLT